MMMEQQLLNPINVEETIHQENLKDAQELADSALKLREIHEDLLALIGEQGEILGNVEEKTEEVETILEDTNIQLTQAAKFSKLKIVPVVIGGSVGALLFGIPVAPLIGGYSILTALGGGVLGGFIGGKVSK